MLQVSRGPSGTIRKRMLERDVESRLIADVLARFGVSGYEARHKQCGRASLYRACLFCVTLSTPQLLASAQVYGISYSYHATAVYYYCKQ